MQKFFLFISFHFILFHALRVRLINTLQSYSNTFFTVSSIIPIFTFQGLWNSKYYFVSQSKYPLRVESSDFSMDIWNIQYDSEYISLIIYETLTSEISIYVKVDDLSNLEGCDKARWSIINLSKQNLKNDAIITSQTSDCYNCLNIYTDKVDYLSNETSILNYENLTTHQFSIQILDDFSFQLNINENGVYTYFLLDGDTQNPLILQEIIDSEPNRVWVPLVVALFILIALCLIRVIYYYLYNIYQVKKSIISSKKPEDLQPLNAVLIDSQPPAKKLSSSRVESLDTFRGIALVIMIFVNYGGGNYWFFNHSTWNGITVADLVFPWFIWIMGTSMALSFDKLQKSKPAKDFSHLDFVYKIVRRSLILWFLGMFVNNGYDLGNWRIPGVLQRFGVGYLLIALIVSYIPKLDIKVMKPFKDILDYLLQWAVVLTIVLVYLLITYVSKLEGCPRGYTGPGGIGDYGKYDGCTGGVALLLDQNIFRSEHIYTEPTCKGVYKTGMFDPEGFLGNFTSLFLTFTGYQCGRILINYKEDKDKLIRWIVWGVVLCAIATGLCGASKNEGIVPLNKNLWSISFVLLLGGLAFLCIALCYFLVDMKKWWLGWPFIYVGRNSIAVYMGSEVLQGYFPFSFRNDGSHAIGLVSHLLGVGVWMWIAWRMNEEGVFIKV